MKAIHIALLFAVVTVLNAGEASKGLRPVSVERWAELKTTLLRTKYPILLPELMEKLGGGKSMKSGFSARGEKKDGKYREFVEIAISDPNFEVGYYGIEFEVRDLRPDVSEVIAARLCFFSPIGERFYADD